MLTLFSDSNDDDAYMFLEFYQPEAEVCKIYVNGSEGYVNSSDVSEEALRNTIDYGMILDCMWIITVDPGKKVPLLKTKLQDQ